MCLYITGHLETVFPVEYGKEMLRFIYVYMEKGQMVAKTMPHEAGNGSLTMAVQSPYLLGERPGFW